MRKHRVATIVALLAITASGCGGGLKHKPPTPPKLSGQTSTLSLGLPQQALTAPVTGEVPGDQVLHVNVVLKVSDATLNQLGSKFKGGQTPPPGDVAKKLGISDADVKKVEDYFASANIHTTTSKTKTTVSFDVKASIAAQLLQTKFVNHKLNGRTFFTPDPANMPKVPKEIAGYILAVTGLDNYSVPVKKGIAPAVAHAFQQQVAAAKASGNCPNFTATRPQTATPTRVANAYGVSKFWQQGWHGEGMTINLLEIDGFDPSDIPVYNACTNSHIQLDTVAMGAAPAPEGETTLDIAMIAGLAPSVKIIDYQEDASGAGSWGSMYNALQAIIDNNQNNVHAGNVVSISLGAPEGALTQDVFQAINQQFRILTQVEHMTLFVSSGDCGAYTDGTYGAAPDVAYPASSPYVISVGGTRMVFNGNRLTDEKVWSDRSDLTKCQNSWGGGGGVSKAFQRPSYQTGPGTDNQYSTGSRQVPDVSAAAIEIPIYFKGQWVGTGGTSAAAPIWAAGMSLMNQGMIARDHYYFYGPDALYWAANHGGARKPFHDVVNGDNLYYRATHGWDNASGWGSPNWPELFNTLQTAPN